MDVIDNNKRIAKNTVILYVRMCFLMVLTLYTSRVVLDALGVEEYGIYNVVGGFVLMFGVISNSLTAAITRFITFEIGTGNKKRLNDIFCTSINVQLIMGIVVAIIIETFGLWFLQAKMEIPTERIFAAQFVLQFSLITFIINLISVPYNAAIIAHEKMNAYAIISILDAILKLLICYPLYWGKYDRLILYAILMALESLVIRFIYGLYCKRHFEECEYHFILDKNLLKELFSFSGWNFIGASSSVLRDQGVNVLLNVFWGATVNAARGVANQVHVAVIAFSNNVITAINPQITKNYAAGNLEYVFQLVIKGARLSFFLMLLITLPLILETEAVLQLWLTKIPDYSFIFVRLVLIFVLVENISNTMITLQLATGNIKKYQIVVGGCQLLNFPISYIILKIGFEPYMTMVVAIVLSLTCFILRLFLLKEMVNFPVARYLKEVVLNVLLVTSISSIVPILVHLFLPSSLTRLLITLFTCTICVAISVYAFGLTEGEKQAVNMKIKTALKYEYRK